MNDPIRRVAASVALGVMVLAGCGVPLEDQAEPLPMGALPSATPTVTVTPKARATSVYFVSGDKVVAADEPIADRSANGVMAALETGPPVDQQAQLRTLLPDPLTRIPMLSVVSVSPGGEVELRRTEAYLRQPAVDQVLLVGQVVLSLAEIGMSSVVITDPAGLPMTLTLPDGRVKEGPVTAADFESLIAG